MDHYGPQRPSDHFGPLVSRTYLVHHTDMAEETSFTQFKLRLPAALHARLEQAAAASGRSITAEMITRLDRSLKSIDDMVIEHRLAEMQVNGFALMDLERQRDEMKADLEKCRGPEQMDRRRALLAAINVIQAEITRHEKFHRQLDDEIEAVRNGHLPQAIEP